MKGAFITGNILDIIKIFLLLSIIATLFLITGLQFSDVTNIISNLITLLWNWFTVY